jgi:shikimate kinase
MKSNIALIGFMGTGKTVVGQELSKRLGMAFIETDSLISARAKKPIPEIFEDDGETHFRELEIEVIKWTCRETRSVIACGGGVVLNWINVERLRECSAIVLLTASPAATLRRISREVGQRPLLEVEDPLARIREMAKFRSPFYARAADFTVSTSRLSVAEVVETIVDRLKEDASFDWPK